MCQAKYISALIKQRNRLNELIDEMKEDYLKSCDGLFRIGQHLQNMNIVEDDSGSIASLTIIDRILDDNCEILYKCTVVEKTIYSEDNVKFDMSQKIFDERTLLNLMNSFYEVVFRFNVGDEVRIDGITTKITKRYIKNGIPTYNVKYIGSVTEKEIEIEIPKQEDSSNSYLQ